MFSSSQLQIWPLWMVASMPTKFLQRGRLYWGISKVGVSMCYGGERWECNSAVYIGLEKKHQDSNLHPQLCQGGWCKLIDSRCGASFSWGSTDGLYGWERITSSLSLTGNYKGKGIDQSTESKIGGEYSIKANTTVPSTYPMRKQQIIEMTDSHNPYKNILWEHTTVVRS